VATQVETPELESQEAAVRSGPSLLQIAWQRKSLVILGVLVGLVLGLLYYAQRQPVYQSTAQLLVVKKTPEGSLQLSQTDNRISYMEDYMSTQQVLIRSPEIVTRAVRMPMLQDLQSYPEKGDELAYILRDGLNVLRDSKDSSSQNNILNLSFRGPVADECPKIVNAVVMSYQNFLNDTYKSVSERTLELIMKAKDTLENQVQVNQKRYQDWRQQTPYLFLTGQPGSINFNAERLAQIDKRRNDLKLKLTEMTDRLAQIEKTKKDQGRDAALQLIAATGTKIQLSTDRRS
jgi:succinoglycan biosynthesis transport protein ExoP